MFKLDYCKLMSTPRDLPCNMSKEESSTKICQKLYRGITGSLIYFIASRPYILFSIFISVRFQLDPRETHLTIIKRIFRYLKGTTNLGLLYKKSLDYKASWIL